MSRDSITRELKYQIESNDIATLQNHACNEIKRRIKGKVSQGLIGVLFWMFSTIAFLAIYNAIIRGEHWTYFVIPICVFGALILFIALQVIWKRSVLKAELISFGSFPLEETLCVEENGLRIRRSNAESFMAWSALLDIDELSIGPVIEIPGLRFWLVPNNAFSDKSSKSEFIALVREQLDLK